MAGELDELGRAANDARLRQIYGEMTLMAAQRAAQGLPDFDV